MIISLKQRKLKIEPRAKLNHNIYKSLILLHYDYSNNVWGNYGKGLALKLEKLQNRAAKILTGSEWDVTTRLLPLEDFSLSNIKYFHAKSRKNKINRKHFCYAKLIAAYKVETSLIL